MRASNAQMQRATFLGLLLLLVFSFGCGPPPPQGDSPPASTDSLELTDEMIHERITYAWVRDVPSEDGTGEPITWSFRRNEPREITIVDKQVERTRATVVLDIKTQTTPRSRPQRRLAGQIRTAWELKTGWALRKWEIVNTENISMKYKNFPNPPAENPNR
jgi:hypothetical protein